MSSPDCAAHMEELESLLSAERMGKDDLVAERKVLGRFAFVIFSLGAFNLATAPLIFEMAKSGNKLWWIPVVVKFVIGLCAQVILFFRIDSWVQGTPFRAMRDSYFTFGPHVPLGQCLPLSVTARSLHPSLAVLLIALTRSMEWIDPDLDAVNAGASSYSWTPDESALFHRSFGFGRNSTYVLGGDVINATGQITWHLGSTYYLDLPFILVCLFWVTWAFACLGFAAYAKSVREFLNKYQNLIKSDNWLDIDLLYARSSSLGCLGCLADMGSQMITGHYLLTVGAYGATLGVKLQESENNDQHGWSNALGKRRQWESVRSKTIAFVCKILLEATPSAWFTVSQVGVLAATPGASLALPTMSAFSSVFTVITGIADNLPRSVGMNKSFIVVYIPPIVAAFICVLRLHGIQQCSGPWNACHQGQFPFCNMFVGTCIE